MRRVQFLLPFLLLFLSSTSVGADDDSQGISQPGTIAPLLEDDLREARADIKKIQGQIRVIDDLTARISKTRIDKTAPRPDAQKKWESARKYLQDAKQTSPASKSFQTHFADNFYNALEGSFDAPRETINSIQGAMGPLADRSSGEFRYIVGAYNAANKVISQFRSELQGNDDPLSVVFDSQLDPSLPRSNGLPDLVPLDSTEYLKLEPMLNNDFQKVYADIQNRFNAVAEKAHAAALDELKKDKDALQTDLKDKRSALAELITQFQKGETRKAQTDQSLVYAVYGMIVVLLFLFLSLKVFTDDVAKALIEHRSLVEVVSMAFMLITIIILGTGEKLSKEILGTLLGTIAGYVFARGTEDKKGGAGTVEKGVEKGEKGDGGS